MWNLKGNHKLVNKTKKKQSHRLTGYREQTSDYQWRGRDNIEVDRERGSL